MTLVPRTIMTFAWIVLLMLVACGYALVGLDRLEEEEARQQRIGEALAHAHFLDAASLQAMLLVEQYLDTRDPAKLADLARVRAGAEERRRALRAMTVLPEVRQLVDAFDSLQPHRLRVTDDMLASEGDELVMFRRKRDALDQAARSFLGRIVAIESEAMARARRETELLGRELRRNTTIVFAVTLVLTVLTSFAMIRGISRRVMPLVQMAPRVSQGDFAARVPVEGRDEIAMLSAALNRMAGDLQELDTAKEEFVALASHQLRTPATAVKANLAMLLDGYFGEVTAEQREYLRDAYDANERQLQVIDEILYVARVETGRLAIQKANVEMKALVEAAVAEGRFAIGTRRQDLEVSMPTQAVELSADAPKLRMVVDNLLSNASKYTPEGGRIHVSLQAEGPDVVLEVRDTGVGISPEDQRKLFAKFSRVGNPLSVSAGGTGLGLYLAREIVHLHAGEITVESREGEGSVFRVRLPRE
jgi:signal transduction histidine kinase